MQCCSQGCRQSPGSVQRSWLSCETEVLGCCHSCHMWISQQEVTKSDEKWSSLQSLTPLLFQLLLAHLARSPGGANATILSGPFVQWLCLSIKVRLPGSPKHLLRYWYFYVYIYIYTYVYIYIYFYTCLINLWAERKSFCQRLLAHVSLRSMQKCIWTTLPTWTSRLKAESNDGKSTLISPSQSSSFMQ